MKQWVGVALLAALGAAGTSATAEAQSRRYIVISRSDSGVAANVLTQIQRARGRVERNLSAMGLVAVTSDNPEFARSVPDALVVAPDMRVTSPRPRFEAGTPLAAPAARRARPAH